MQLHELHGLGIELSRQETQGHLRRGSCGSCGAVRAVCAVRGPRAGTQLLKIFLLLVFNSFLFLVVWPGARCQEPLVACLLLVCARSDDLMYLMFFHGLFMPVPFCGPSL